MTILIANKVYFKAVDITRDNNQRVNQEDTMIIYVCTPKKGASKCRNQTLIKLQGGIDETTVIVIS